jgi:hypothetical protein
MEFGRQCRANPTEKNDRHAFTSGARMACLEAGLTLEALFVFAAFALVFAIGLELGLLIRRP